MDENIEKTNKTYEKWEETYINMPKIELNNFFNSNDLEILKKIGIEIEDKIYTEYEYHIIEMILYKYYEVDENDQIKQVDKLIEKNVKLEEYEKILDIFSHISSYYNL